VRAVGDGGQLHGGFADAGQAGEGEFGALDEHVEADDDDGDRYESDDEEREGANQFANKIELRSDDDGKERPQPEAPAVVHWTFRCGCLSGGCRSCRVLRGGCGRVR